MYLFFIGISIRVTYCYYVVTCTYVITITSTYTLNGYPIQPQDTGLIMLSVGPPSATLAQHSTIIGSMYRVCWSWVMSYEHPFFSHPGFYNVLVSAIHRIRNFHIATFKYQITDGQSVQLVLLQVNTYMIIHTLWVHDVVATLIRRRKSTHVCTKMCSCSRLSNAFFAFMDG